MSPKVVPKLKEITKDADVLVISGDITSFDEKGFLDGFLAALEKLPLPTLVVPGNNETPDFPVLPPVRNIDGTRTSLEGVTFGGLGGSPPTPFNTPNEYTEDQLEAKLAKLGRVDVLVSHTPPWGTALDMGGRGDHLGSFSVRSYVLSQSAKLCLSGHVHESKAVEMLGTCLCCNPGPASMGGYARITYGGRVKAELSLL